MWNTLGKRLLEGLTWIRKKLFLVCLFLGFFGGHYFAIGKVKRGVLYLFTAGLFGIGWIYDLIRIATCDDFVGIIEVAEVEKKEVAVAKIRNRNKLTRECRNLKQKASHIVLNVNLLTLPRIKKVLG